MKTEPELPHEQAQNEGKDVELNEALSNFRQSIHAWADLEYSRPRTLVEVRSRRKIWRLAAGWAFGCVMVAGGVSGGVYVRHHRQEVARVEAQRQAEQQRLAAEEQAREMDELLAQVDRDVSREVPSAMEPLTQLMAEDEYR